MQVYAANVSTANEPKKQLSTAEVAEKAGVHRDTLLRWLRAGDVSEPRRDRHGWRVFTPKEASAVVSYANPLACLISTAKTSRLGEGDKDRLVGLGQRALQLAGTIAVDDQPTLFPSARFVSKAPRPDSDAIQFWFDPFVVEELAEILS